MPASEFRLLIERACSLQSSGAALSPRRATYFLLLRQEKVSKEKATLVPASLHFATGNLRCSAQPGSRSNSLRFTSLRQSRAPIRLGFRSSAHSQGFRGRIRNRIRVRLHRDRYYFHSCLRTYYLGWRPKTLTRRPNPNPIPHPTPSPRGVAGPSSAAAGGSGRAIV
jgi:hypothetical protein